LGGLVLNNNTAKAIEIIESMAEVRNMRSYASDDGKDLNIDVLAYTLQQLLEL
jgi:hypothetical protein